MRKNSNRLRACMIVHSGRGSAQGARGGGGGFEIIMVLENQRLRVR